MLPRSLALPLRLSDARAAGPILPGEALEPRQHEVVASHGVKKAGDTAQLPSYSECL